MPTSSWTLEHNGITKTFADWGLVHLQFAWNSMAASEASFDLDGDDITTEDVFEYEDVIKIFHPSGTKWFHGFIVDPSTSGTPDFQGKKYLVRDLWHILDSQCFQAQRDFVLVSGGVVGAVQSQYIPEILLNWNGLGIEDVKVTLAAILDFAIAQNPGLFTRGSLLEGETIYPPIEEVRDVMCSEAMRRVAKWAADAMSAVDHSGTLPSLSIFTRADAPGLTLSIGDDPVVTAEFRPRYDLQYDAVAIRYKTTDTLDGEPRVSYRLDVWPEAASVVSRSTLCLSVDLLGVEKTTSSANIVTEEIDTSDIEWWKKHYAPLRGNTVGPLTLGEVRGPFLKSNAAGNTDLVNELLSTAMPRWVQNADGDDDALTEQQTFSAVVYGKEYTDSTLSVLKHDFSVIGKVIHVSLKATDAESGEYTTTDTAQEGDPQPTGLARYLQGVLSVLQWQGGLTTTESEVTGFVRPGALLNLTGGKTAWSSMNALVQQVREDADSGTTTATVGPGAHLNIPDIISFLKNTRQRRRWTRLRDVETGDVPDQLEQGENTPSDDSNENDPASTTRVLFGDTPGTKKIEVSAKAAGGIAPASAASGPATSADAVHIKLNDAATVLQLNTTQSFVFMSDGTSSAYLTTMGGAAMTLTGAAALTSVLTADPPGLFLAGSTIILNTALPNGRIELNAADCGGQVIKVREFRVCVNGSDRFGAKFAMSEIYPLP